MIKKNTYDLRKRKYIIDILILFKLHTGYMLCVHSPPTTHTLPPQTGNDEQLHGNYNKITKNVEKAIFSLTVIFTDYSHTKY